MIYVTRRSFFSSFQLCRCMLSWSASNVCFVQVHCRFLAVNSRFFGFYFLKHKDGCLLLLPMQWWTWRTCLLRQFNIQALHLRKILFPPVTQWGKHWNTGNSTQLTVDFSFHRCLLNSRFVVVEMVSFPACIKSCNQGIWAKSRGLGLSEVCQFVLQLSSILLWLHRAQISQIHEINFSPRGFRFYANSLKKTFRCPQSNKWFNSTFLLGAIPMSWCALSISQPPCD